ncbi:MAG: I78 family peptidase inhibitor [Pseudomonadota bacterium]
MASRSLILAVLVALAACTAPESELVEAEPLPEKGGAALVDETSPEEQEPTPCGAENYQNFVGKPLAAVTYPDDLRARVLRPGAMVTMEYVAERMNIHVDDEGIILRVICG